MFTIGLFEKSIRFLETNRENKISFAGAVSDNFELENLFKKNKLSDTYINNAAELINRVIEESRTSSDHSRLLIDTNKCFANVIPLDFSEKKEKLNSNILWELSNYFPDNYKEFKVSYHKLLSDSYSSQVRDTLIIGILNSNLETLKKLSRLLNIKITSIDIEHFAAEKYFRAIRKSLFKDENIMVIGSKKSRFDFSIINDSGCLHYDYYIPRELNFQDNFANAFIGTEKKYRNLQINNIYLYGDETAADSYSIINDLSEKSRVFLSNPFYEIGITEKVKTEIVSEGYKYIPLCGLASEAKK
ncbi:MAG: pilus assembly protein PilM [Ignavibacteriae bacterium]|nr:pilus assembly protein PilM [Ignavibacteriota bacterium]